MKVNKTKYAQHLEIVLKNNGICADINSKNELRDSYNQLQDLIVDSFFESDEPEKYEAVEKEQRAILISYLKEGNSTFISGNDEVLVSPSAKKEGSYQVTYFDEKGAKSDSQQASLESTVSYLITNSILPVNKEKLEYLTPKGVINMNLENTQQKQKLMKQRSIER